MFSTHRFVQHRAHAFVAVLMLAAVALILAACGGGDSDSGGSGGGGGGNSADAETLLRQTFTGSHEIRSGSADVQLRIVATGDPSIRGPIELRLAGPFQSAGRDEMPQFDMALDVNAQGQGFKAGLTSTSDALFVRFGGTNYKAPDDLLAQLKDSYRRSQREGSPQSFSSLGLDPISWLEDPTVEGTETVGGTETDHISAGVNVDTLLDDVDKVLAKVSRQGLPTGQQVPERIPADARADIEEAVKDAKVDVWSGTEDHTLRKLTLVLDVEPPEGSDGPRTLDLTLSIELSELNEPQTIEPPATSRPLDELLGQLQGLLGGAFGGAGGSGGGSGSAGGASSEELDAYTACIQRAGSDVAEAQKCASLLTQ